MAFELSPLMSIFSLHTLCSIPARAALDPLNLSKSSEPSRAESGILLLGKFNMLLSFSLFEWLLSEATAFTGG